MTDVYVIREEALRMFKELDDNEFFQYVNTLYRKSDHFRQSAMEGESPNCFCIESNMPAEMPSDRIVELVESVTIKYTVRKD